MGLETERVIWHTQVAKLYFHLWLHSIIRLLKQYFFKGHLFTVLWFVCKRAARLQTGYFPMTKMFKHLQALTVQAAKQQLQP